MKRRLSIAAPGASAGSLWNSVLPMLQGVDPQRVRILHSAFQQLELQRTEQVLLSAPLFNVYLP